MRLFIRADRCQGRRGGRARLRLVGLDEPTAYGTRRLIAGIYARCGHMRLRVYLLGRTEPAAVAQIRWAREYIADRYGGTP